MKKAIIGLMPLWDSEKNSYWMIPGYEEGIMTVGGIPVILPMTKDIAALEQLEDVCDGFFVYRRTGCKSVIIRRGKAAGMWGNL